MSRIGRLPIKIPANVTVTSANHKVTVKGPLGQTSIEVNPDITVEVANNIVHLTRANEEKIVKSMHGMYRSIINNMIHGVVKPFVKELVVNGVGYKVSKQGKKLVMNVGLSHQINFDEPEGIKIECPTATEIVISGIDKDLVGQTASDIRALRPMEPYHGYGIHYKTEPVILKEGKTAAKK